MAILKNKILRFGSYGEDYSAEKLEDVADRYEDVIGNNRVRNSAESVSGSQLMRGQEIGFVNNSADLTGAESSNESPAEEGGEETQSYGY